MIELERNGHVFVARMDNGENRFSPAMLEAIDEVLDEVESAEGPKALVTTGTGKFFTNGLDLEWLDAHPGEMVAYIRRVNGIYARLLSLPCATVAAMNGHAFGAGGMLAIAHDHRLMRVDRGYWCLPEVNLGMMFPRGMNELVAARLPALTAHEAMVGGGRYGSTEAVAAGIAGRALDEADLLPEAIALAEGLAEKAGNHMRTIRTTLHADVLAALLQN